MTAKTDPSLGELTRTFAHIGVLSFGGPAAQIALMHRVILDEKKWVAEADYLRALSFCMLLPGPEAMQVATWIGWRLHGLRGGLIAGGLFVLPGALVVLGLSLIYAGFGNLPVIAALFTGVQAAVIAIVIEALIRVSKRALKSREAHVIAVAAFAGLFFFKLPFPLIILAAGLWGFFRTATVERAPTALPPPAALARSLRAAGIWLAVWLLPLAALVYTAPARLTEIGVFFSKLAVLTFGGAYAVLAWMAQDVVQTKGWLTLPQMMDGLGLAETTPGPLILVTEFVGFMAAHQVGGWVMGLAGGGDCGLDDLCAVVSVRVHRRALHRPANPYAASFGRTGGHYCRCRWGHRESVAVVCPARAVFGPDGSAPWPAACSLPDLTSLRLLPGALIAGLA